ncbi:hypothetical protein [Saccharothrix texasensis]|nr:hypothetical protein [Saccharothrix texasensis]
MSRTTVARTLTMLVASYAVCLVCSFDAAGAQPTTTTTPEPVSTSSQQPSSAPPTTSGVDKVSPSGSDDKALWPPDWSQMVPEWVATFTGAALALWTALRLDRASRGRARASERAAQADRLRETLKLIGRELEWNSREIEAVMGDLTTGLQTDRAPMTDAWSAHGTEAMAVGGMVATSLSEAYALLRRCRRVLEQYTGDLARGGPGLRVARDQTLPRLREVLSDTRAALDVARVALAEKTSEISA